MFHQLNDSTPATMRECALVLGIAIALALVVLLPTNLTSASDASTQIRSAVNGVQWMGGYEIKDDHYYSIREDWFH